MKEPTIIQASGVPLPATGRLGIVAAYFYVTGTIAGMIATGAAATLLFPGLGWRTLPANPWIALAGAGIICIGFLRTGKALRQRRRVDVQAAFLAFVTPVLDAAATGSAPSRSSLIVAASGVALLASVWRHVKE